MQLTVFLPTVKKYRKRDGVSWYQVVLHGTIKNPLSHVTCGFWCYLILLDIVIWYESRINNKFFQLIYNNFLEFYRKVTVKDTAISYSVSNYIYKTETYKIMMDRIENLTD